MTNVLVTGGAGFIGHHLVRRLLDDGQTVTVIDDLSGGYLWRLPLDHPRLRFVHADILTVDNPIGDAEIVYHLAARPRPQRSINDPGPAHQVNVDGTFRLLLAARDRARRFVFASSGSVYGKQATLPLVETMLPNPMSPYALHKWIGEQYCDMFAWLYKLPTIALRFFNVYGRGMTVHDPYAAVIPRFIDCLQRGEPAPIFGDGEQSRDFTHVSDVVAAIVRAGDTEVGGVYNIGSGERQTINAIAARITQALGGGTEHLPPVIEPRTTLADAQRARDVLGWQAQVGFDVGLADMIAEARRV